MSHSIADIEGIGPTHARQLKRLGIHTTGSLLDRCASRKGRRCLAEATGIAESYILRWTNRADLMRIRGVGEDYAELLEAAGVETVKELKHRNAANLAAAMIRANAERKMVRLPPGEKRVANWIEQARTLPPLMNH